jgi:hypothetical protein
LADASRRISDKARPGGAVVRRVEAWRREFVGVHAWRRRSSSASRVEEERSAEAWRRSGQSERSGWGEMRRKNVGVGLWWGRARACYSSLRV